MDAPRQEEEAAATTERRVTSRHATHWLFAHLVGVRGVAIPDTALFDDEGVLTAWLYTHASPCGKPVAKTRPPKPKPEPEAVVVVRSRDVLELSLLRLEAHLQDLARDQPTDKKGKPSQAQRPVAVVYDRETESETTSPPGVLTEAALDETVRMLCARERSMTSPEPDLAVARAYPGGRLVLQAVPTHTRPSADKPLPTDAVTIVTSYQCDHGTSKGFTHAITPLAAAATSEETDSVERRERETQRWTDTVRLVDWSTVFAQAEAQCRAVLTHLRSTHSLVVRRLTLAFACVAEESATGDRRLLLTSARYAEWTRQSKPISQHEKRPHRQQQPSHGQGLSAARPATFRVCRQCRTPGDVDLARELQQQQTLVRSVLAKYQHQGEMLADAETRCRWAADRTAELEKQLVAVETENLRLRERITMHTSETQCIDDEKLVLEQHLRHAQQQHQRSEQQLHSASTQIRDLLRQQTQQQQDAEQQTASWQREWDALNARRRTEMRDVQHEMERLVAHYATLQKQFEETRASRDELRFQWAFVVRKLTCVGDDGVLPPRRIAGGYSSYPTPTARNVEQVVKWIVDYEAQRTVLDASLVTSPPKSAKRRLQIKVELMRLLATAPAALSLSPRARSRSPTRRRSPRRKASPSPEKKTTSPAKRMVMSPSTLVHDQLVDAAAGERVS